jgi:hypothetical protein
MNTTKTDHSNMKLGKSHPVNDPRTLQLANYLNAATLPPVPAEYTYAANIEPTAWGMMANDKLNDCTCAAAAHLIMEWTDDNGAICTPCDQDIINAYVAITGYDAATGANNIGVSETTLLNYWRQTGIGSHKILGYAALEPKNDMHIKLCIFLFGGCHVGLALPLSAKTQPVWSVPPGGAQGTGAPGSWGGHAVCVIGYDNDGLTVITWGATKKMTWSFWNTYCDESYAIISIDFCGTKPAPNGFDLACLVKDLGELVD